MVKIMRKIILIIFIVSFFGCNEDTIVQSSIDYSEVQFDLQGGFENQSISIIIDTSRHFHALLSELVPLAGAQASFTVLLERESHELIVHGMSLSSIYETSIDTCKFEIADAKRYYVGLSKHKDSIRVIVQDSSFSYF